MANKTKTLQKHMNNVAELGCLVCGRPPHLHHIRPKGTGIGRRSSDYCVIPLCHDHHQGQFSIHNSKKSFEKKYGTEEELLKKVYRYIYKEHWEEIWKKVTPLL